MDEMRLGGGLKTRQMHTVWPQQTLTWDPSLPDSGREGSKLKFVASKQRSGRPGGHVKLGIFPRVVGLLKFHNMGGRLGRGGVCWVKFQDTEGPREQIGAVAAEL